MADDLIFEFRTPIDKLKGDLAQARGLMRQFGVEIEREETTRNRRLSASQVRELQRSHREQLREHSRAARQAAAEYERQLGGGFFSRLARSATDAFKRNFSVSGVLGGSGGGGGGILGGAASVLGGNILTSVLGGITSQITGAIKTGFDFNKLKEQTLLGFEIKLKGKREAEDFFNQVAKFAEDTPLELDQALTSVQRLMVAFTAPEALRTMKAITDEVAKQAKVGGEAQEAINGIGLQLQQILLKGKVQQEELVSLAERQVDVYSYLTKELARQDREFAKLDAEQQKQRLAELVQKGMIDARAAVAAIVKGMEEDAGGTAARIARETAEGMESNIKDSLTRTAGIASESAFAEYKKFLGRSLDFLNTGAAERIAGSISATTGGLFEGLEKTLSAISSGNLGQLGLNAVNSAAEGVKSGAKGLYDAGAGAAGQVEQGWRDRLDQHSPSQVMLDLGFEAGQSLIDGFMQGAGGRRLGDEIERIIEEAAARWGIDPNLIRAVMRRESGGRRGAVSPKGASGLMQLMPGTAARYGARNMFDPTQNINAGAHYLADLLKMFGGDVSLALAGYNAGEGAVKKYGNRIPPYAETQAYVPAVLDQYKRLSGGAVSSAVPVVIQNIQPLQDFFSQFVGKGYTPGIALGHNVPDRPASGDLTGGVGYFAGDFNPRGFAERLYALQKSMPASDRTTVAEQADWQHTVSMMAEEYHISRAVMLKIQDMVAQRLDDERKALTALSAQGAVNGGSVNPLTYEEVKRRIADASANRPIPQESGIIATQIAAQPLASVKLIAKEAGDSFTNLPPLVKKSGKEMEKEMAEVARNVSGMLGGFLQSTLRGQWREGLRGMKDDFLSWAVSLAEDWIQSRIFKLLSSKGGGASGGGGGGGGLLNTALGGLGKLFGLGGSGAKSGAGPWVDPAAFTREFGEAPGVTGGAAAAGGLNFAALGASGLMAGGGLLGGLLGRGAAGQLMGSAGGTLLGGSIAAAIFNPALLPAMFSNPVTAIVGAGLLGGALLTRLLGGRHKTEKALRDAIKQAHGVDVKDMAVLGQIKQVGEAAFGKGQVRKNLAQVVQLEPVKQLVEDYAERTGQSTRPQLPHEFLFNTVGGPSAPPIAVEGNALLPSPFTKGSTLAGAQAPDVSAGGLAPGRGSTGDVLAEVLNHLRAADARAATHTALMVQSMREVSGALRPFTTASPGAIVERGLDTYEGTQAAGEAVYRHAAGNGEFVDNLARAMRVP